MQINPWEQRFFVLPSCRRHKDESEEKIAGDAMPSSALVKGTLILSLASVFCRILGLGNRMLLSRLIGAEGLGLFQMIIPFYAMTAVIATLGLPGAVVKTVSDRHAHGDIYGIEQVKNIALGVVYKSAALGALLLLFLSYSPFTAYFPDERIIVPMRLMPLPLLCAAIASIYKGYFQGQENMVPTAVSQVVEQVARVSFSILGVLYFLPYGLEFAILGIVVGIAVGEIVGLGFILFYYCVYRKNRALVPTRHPRFSWQVSRELSSLAFPLLLIRLSASFAFTVQSFLIPARLQHAGFSAAEATSLLGQLLGMALPLLFLPTVLIVPLSTALVPSIAKAFSLQQHKKLRRLLAFALGGAFGTGMVCGIVFFLFSEPLTQILYNSRIGAPLLAQLALVAPFAYLQFVTASILHGLGRPGSALFNEMLGTAASLLIIYVLTADPAFGIQGALWGYKAGFSLSALVGLLSIYKFLPRDKN
jgi:stage V sporulation protein B